jgi:hypothetical protein
VEAFLYIIEPRLQSEAPIVYGSEEYGKRFIDAGPRRSRKINAWSSAVGCAFTPITK